MKKYSSHHVGIVFVLMLLAGSCQNDRTISFNDDIRPILNDKCLRCHGGVRASGGFSLLFETDAFDTTDTGRPAIVRGNHAKSTLYQRLVSEDPELRMPQDGDPLSETEIEKIARWIDEGAVWEEHWAYLPPTQIETPSVPENDSIHNEIDVFVQESLKARGLAASAKADTLTIIRRLYLDLLGLPPESRDVHKIEIGVQREGWESLIDSLLASPHFGESWASMWLDLARYADTKGYEKDSNREIWRYRDWVIKAFNDDMPFDQFTIAQLAGDLLPNPKEEQLIATAFHRNAIANDEGGTDDEEFRVASVIDRVNTTYEVWQGATMSCVQCHNHPYDPFRNEDYYTSMAYFNNVVDRDLYNEQPKLLSYTGETSEYVAEQVQWINTHLPDPYLLEPNSNIRATYEALLDSLDYTYLEAEEFQSSGNYIELIWPDLDMVWQVMDSNWVKFDSIDFTDVESMGFYAATALHHAGDISIHLDSLDSEEIGRIAIRKTGEWDGWQFSRPPQDLVKEFKTSIQSVSGIHDVYFRFWLGDTYIQHLFYLDRIFFYKKAAPWKNLNPDIQKRIKDLSFIKPTTTPILQELGKDKSRKTYLYERGSWLSPGEEVKPGLPGILEGNTPAPGDRLSFAEWLVSPANPLTARVIVNRVWEKLFGRGIVETSEDFGTQGSPPSHPELLDWLSRKLVDDFDWRLKPLIKLIVQSHTYQQGSAVQPQLYDLDPNNVWLSHYPRTRLSAEIIRDQILGTSGLLNPEIGGPSVIIPELNIQSSFIPHWALTDEENLYRRTLYIFWKRTDPFADMITFDSPDRTVCTSRRVTTNTPLQALNLLNDEIYFEAATTMARDFYRSGQDMEEVISKMYRHTTLRDITPQRLEYLMNFYTQMLDSEDAKQSRQSSREEYALSLVANVLYNLDEFVTKS